MVSGLGASPRQRESYTWFTAELANLHDGASRARYGGSPMQDLTAHQSFGHSDCERIVGGTLAQPVLALTSLGYVAAGVAVLCWAARVMAPLAGLPEWRSWRSGPGASPTTGPSHHGRSAPTTCRWSPWLWCPPPAWLGARAGSGGRPRRQRRGSSHQDWLPTPRDARGRSYVGPRARGSTTAPGTSSLPLPPDGPPGPWRRAGQCPSINADSRRCRSLSVPATLR